MSSLHPFDIQAFLVEMGGAQDLAALEACLLYHQAWVHELQELRRQRAGLHAQFHLLDLVGLVDDELGHIHNELKERDEEAEAAMTTARASCWN
jgi:hypothetical protein